MSCFSAISTRRMSVRVARDHMSSVTTGTGSTGEPVRSRPVPWMFSRGDPRTVEAMAGSSAVRRKSSVASSSVSFPRR